MLSEHEIKIGDMLVWPTNYVRPTNYVHTMDQEWQGWTTRILQLDNEHNRALVTKPNGSTGWVTIGMFCQIIYIQDTI